jgi:hypothetical protein
MRQSGCIMANQSHSSIFLSLAVTVVAEGGLFMFYSGQDDTLLPRLQIFEDPNIRFQYQQCHHGATNGQTILDIHQQ